MSKTQLKNIRCIKCNDKVTHSFDIGVANTQIIGKVVCKSCFQDVNK